MTKLISSSYNSFKACIAHSPLEEEPRAKSQLLGSCWHPFALTHAQPFMNGYDTDI